MKTKYCDRRVPTFLYTSPSPALPLPPFLHPYIPTSLLPATDVTVTMDKLENVAVAPDYPHPPKRARPDENLTPLPTILRVPEHLAAWRQRLFVPPSEPIKWSRAQFLAYRIPTRISW